MYINVTESCVADDPAGSLTACTMLRDVKHHAIYYCSRGLAFRPFTLTYTWSIYNGYVALSVYSKLREDEN